MNATTLTWDELMNGSKASQETLLAQCEELASYRADFGSIFVLWRERANAGKRWIIRVSCPDYTETYPSLAAARRAHPAFAA